MPLIDVPEPHAVDGHRHLGRLQDVDPGGGGRRAPAVEEFRLIAPAGDLECLFALLELGGEFEQCVYHAEGVERHSRRIGEPVRAQW